MANANALFGKQHTFRGVLRTSNLPASNPILTGWFNMALALGERTHTAVRGLGEVALRVRNLDVMQEFYQQAIGLAVMARNSRAAFLKIADGYDGHTQVLALFDRSAEPGYRGTDAVTSTVDHIAFEIALADFANEKNRLETLGLTVTTVEHAWVHWRSLYVHDPEGNEVELVCYDSSVR